MRCTAALLHCCTVALHPPPQEMYDWGKRFGWEPVVWKDGQPHPAPKDILGVGTGGAAAAAGAPPPGAGYPGHAGIGGGVGMGGAAGPRGGPGGMGGMGGGYHPGHHHMQQRGMHGGGGYMPRGRPQR